MRINQSRRQAGGFSLMELMVVVAIIVLLAGLTIAGMGFIEGKKARDTAAVQVKLIENALQNYHSDNRSYPQHLDPTGERGDEVLYKYLYWDGYVDRENGGVIYMPEFDPENNTKGGQAWMQDTDAQARIVDPWGNYYRYRSGDAPDAQNVDFDLWSCGPDGRTNADPDHQDSQDDIVNWK